MCTTRMCWLVKKALQQVAQLAFSVFELNVVLHHIISVYLSLQYRE